MILTKNEQFYSYVTVTVSERCDLKFRGHVNIGLLAVSLYVTVSPLSGVFP